MERAALGALLEGADPLPVRDGAAEFEALPPVGALTLGTLRLGLVGRMGLTVGGAVALESGPDADNDADTENDADAESDGKDTDGRMGESGKEMEL